MEVHALRRSDQYCQVFAGPPMTEQAETNDDSDGVWLEPKCRHFNATFPCSANYVKYTSVVVGHAHPHTQTTLSTRVHDDSPGHKRPLSMHTPANLLFSREQSISQGSKVRYFLQKHQTSELSCATTQAHLILITKRNDPPQCHTQIHHHN